MHRNAEIWEKRHETLQAMKAMVGRHFGMAHKAPLDATKRVSLQSGWERWLQRWARIERRVWSALCVAKGWRET